MIYVLLNLAMFIFMLVYSFLIDKRGKSLRSSVNIVNLVLYLAVLFLLMAVALSMCLWGSIQMSLLFGRLTYMLAAWFSINCCAYILIFPNKRKPLVLTIFQWIFYILSFYVIFVTKKGFYGISITSDNAIKIHSGPMFNGAFIGYTTTSWFYVHNFFFRIIIPCLSIFMVLIKVEHTKLKLNKQAMLVNISGILVSWLLFYFFYVAKRYQPMLESLILLAFVPQILLFIFAHKIEDILDTKRSFKTFLRILIRFVIPSLILGIAFVLLWPLANKMVGLFVLLFSIVICVVSFCVYMIDKFLRKKGYLRDNRYEENLERDISEINFESEPSLITSSVFELFKKYVDTSSMKILVDSGKGTLETIYSSNEETLEIPTDSETFDSLINLKQFIIFRELLMTNNALVSIRSNLLEMLNSANSDAFILLTEGRQIVGVIFLGKKISGNIYSEYDHYVFNKLYSNFFVIAYYVKNIMNEDVVGTVNREIRMSGQIITSIQENMDPIKNPKIETGYSMVPAHNIGGEFVDLIRLNENRHIFVVGALSGKGIAASMNMVILKSIIRTFLAETKDFKVLVQKVNLFIRESLPKGTFFAGTFGLIDFTTDTLYYINCGTPALFLYTRAYNNIIEIQGEGKVLGFVKDLTSLIKVKKVKLAPGDVVFTCTDGLIETKSLRGEEYGSSRIQSTLLENLTYPADKMVKFTYDSLVTFTSKAIENDVTMLILKYLGGK